MRKRMLATLLALSMVLTLGAGAFADDGAEPEDSVELSDDILDKMTDEERARYEDFIKRHEEIQAGQSDRADGAEPAEVNEYGLTDAATQALAGKIRAHLREDYLSVYGIAAADFSWPEAESDVWRAVVTVPTMAYSTGMSLTDAPEQLGNTFEDESLNALAGAVAAALREWVLEEGDENFNALWGSLTDGRTFSQFVTEYAAFRPAKTAEDPIFDEDAQEIMSYIAGSISEDYLVPNGISPDDFAWPTDQAAWEYYNNLLNQIYTEIAIGGTPEPIREDLVPASPDKEMMDAASQGVANWLYAFESVESGYLDHLYALLKDSQYIMENVTFA